MSMTRDERIKAMRTAVALAAGNVLVPAAVRVAMAALVDEVESLNRRVVELERKLERSE